MYEAGAPSRRAAFGKRFLAWHACAGAAPNGQVTGCRLRRRFTGASPVCPPQAAGPLLERPLVRVAPSNPAHVAYPGTPGTPGTPGSPLGGPRVVVVEGMGTVVLVLLSGTVVVVTGSEEVVAGTEVSTVVTGVRGTDVEVGASAGLDTLVAPSVTIVDV